MHRLPGDRTDRYVRTVKRDDAASKGQVGRQRIFDGLLTRLDEQVS